MVECIRVRYGVCECVRACVEEREREMRPDSVSIVNLKRDDSFNRDSIFIFFVGDCQDRELSSQNEFQFGGSFSNLAAQLAMARTGSNPVYYVLN